MNHPFLVSLQFAFHTPKKIVFGMEFLQGGTLYKHMSDVKRLPEEEVKFYTA